MIRQAVAATRWQFGEPTSAPQARSGALLSEGRIPPRRGYEGAEADRVATPAERHAGARSGHGDAAENCVSAGLLRSARFAPHLRVNHLADLLRRPAGLRQKPISGDRFISNVRILYKNYYLGTYDTADEASRVAMSFKMRVRGVNVG
jgi:hypothetical protein